MPTTACHLIVLIVLVTWVQRGIRGATCTALTGATPRCGVQGTMHQGAVRAAPCTKVRRARHRAPRCGVHGTVYTLIVAATALQYCVHRCILGSHTYTQGTLSPCTHTVLGCDLCARALPVSMRPLCVYTDSALPYPPRVPSTRPRCYNYDLRIASFKPYIVRADPYCSPCLSLPGVPIILPQHDTHMLYSPERGGTLVTGECGWRHA